MKSSENKKIRNATPTQALGYSFRSKLEASVAKRLREKGVDFKYEEVRFELIPTFKYKGKTYRSVHYTPDFICGNIIIECKGFPNDSWSLKEKIIIKYLEANTNYEFYEIHNLTELNELINLIKYGMKEEWKTIVDFPEYEISNLGNVASHKGSKGSRRMIKTFNNPEGYKFAYLYKDKKRHVLSVHRLVAQYFVENPNNNDYVNHKDENKDNNVFTNLEWCSSSYNRSYGTTEYRRVKTLSSKYAVAQYSLDGKFIKKYNSAMEAAKSFGKNNSSFISNCIRGLKSTAYGYKWRKYVDSGEN